MDRLIKGLDKHLKPTKVKRPRKKPAPKKKKPAAGTRSKMTAEDMFHKAEKAEDNLQKIKFYTSAIKLNPEYATAYNNRGSAYDSLGKYDNAIQDYNKAIKLDPEYAIAYNNRGYAYDSIGKYDKAMDHFRDAVEKAENALE